MDRRVAPGAVPPDATVAFLGPSGTFTEEALRAEPDLAAAGGAPEPSFAAVLGAVGDGRADYGFVAIENAIDGTVTAALDQLVFERDLRIVREVVRPITQNLIAPAGTALADVRRVVSFPVATAQCRAWLSAHLPGVEEVAATSTAEAVRAVAGGLAHAAAIGGRRAAELHGLDVLAAGIEDHEHNVTRFVLVAPATTPIPAPTGHDKTSVVCFQSADRPGSLHGILGQFSARAINLVKLESRPTRRGLGDYCFIIDFEGHVADEVVADCLRDLHASLRAVKFLGSYPAAGPAGAPRRRHASAAWRAADDWIAGLRGDVRTHPPQEDPLDTPIDLATADLLLTTTRSVRKRLDLTRPVPREILLDCLRVAQQAPTGSNRQGWQWVVVTDPAKRAALAELYREASAEYLAAAADGDAQTDRVRDSARYLRDHLHEVPVHVIPCQGGRVEGQPNVVAASWYGSIIPAAWSLMLALRARGLGSAWTTFHLAREREAAELLGIPERVTQVALLPVAWTVGTDFRPAQRPPVEEIVHWDEW